MLLSRDINVDGIVDIARSSSSANIEYYRSKTSERLGVRAFDRQLKEIDDHKDRIFEGEGFAQLNP